MSHQAAPATKTSTWTQKIVSNAGPMLALAIAGYYAIGLLMVTR